MDVKNEIIKELTKIVDKKITISTKISELGIDSLDLMELVIVIEKKIGVELSDDIIVSLKEKKIKDIISSFEKLIKQ